MAQNTHGDTGFQVKCGDLQGLTGHTGFGVLTDQHTGFEVVGGKEGIGGILGIGGGIKSDDHNASFAGFLDSRHNGFGVTRGDHDAFNASGDHILNGGYLGSIVAIKFTGGSHQFSALGFGFGFGAFFHLDEERIGIGFSDQTDFYSAGFGSRRGRFSCGGSSGWSRLAGCQEHDSGCN